MGWRPPGRLLRCAATDAAATACSLRSRGKIPLSRYWRHFVLLASPLIGGIALLGGLVTMASAVRVTLSALAMSWQMSAAQIGLLYAAIPRRGGHWRADQRTTGA